MGLSAVEECVGTFIDLTGGGSDDDVTDDDLDQKIEKTKYDDVVVVARGKKRLAASALKEASVIDKRPSYIDAASWQLIQELHQNDDAVRGLRMESTKEETTDLLSVALALELQLEEEARALEIPKKQKQRTKEEVAASLEGCQRRSLDYVQTKALKMHTEALPALKERVNDESKFGAAAKDTNYLDRCLQYIKDDAPIIIHLTEQTLQLLVKDTHYRNLFETKTSGGTKDTTQRSQWESKLFGGAYDSAKPDERPKYGCLNISGDIAGVVPARRYGKCFIILAPHVRYRATFSDRDTGAHPTYSLATHDYYAHILAQYADADLQAALNVPLCGASSKCSVYKEVQIHGPVCLATDVQAVSVPGRASEATQELLETVNAFQKNTNCNILWQGDLLGV